MNDGRVFAQTNLNEFGKKMTPRSLCILFMLTHSEIIFRLMQFPIVISVCHDLSAGSLL